MSRTINITYGANSPAVVGGNVIFGFEQSRLETVRLGPGARLSVNGAFVDDARKVRVDASNRVIVNDRALPLPRGDGVRLELRIEGSVIGPVVARGPDNHVTVTGSVMGHVDATYATTTGAPHQPDIVELDSSSESDAETRRVKKRLRGADHVEDIA